MALIGTYLIYWLILFVASYVVIEYGQYYLYDEATPYAAAKAAGGSLILAALLMWTRSSYDTMFTTDLPWTVLQGIVWFAVFMLVYRFHPQHAAFFGVVTMIMATGLATMAGESVRSTVRPTPQPDPVTKQEIRRPMNTGPRPAPKAPAAPAGAEAAK